MLSLGDFCLVISQIDPDKGLPLEIVEGCSNLTTTTRSRAGFTSTVNTRDLMALDHTYLPTVWDELIQIEHKINFLNECLRSPSDFGFVRSRGLVKIISSQDQTVIHENSPWHFEKYDVNRIDPFSVHRIPQVDKKLTQLEEVHEFLFSAIQFVN